MSFQVVHILGKPMHNRQYVAVKEIDLYVLNAHNDLRTSVVR